MPYHRRHSSPPPRPKETKHREEREEFRRDAMELVKWPVMHRKARELDDAWAQKRSDTGFRGP